MGPIKVYSTPHCKPCLQVKDLLNKLGRAFEERSVINPAYAKEAFEISGQMMVPVTVIGDRIIAGFSKSRIEEALN